MMTINYGDDDGIDEYDDDVVDRLGTFDKQGVRLLMTRKGEIIHKDSEDDLYGYQRQV